MNTTTRKEATELNLKTYFTGTPCKYGHFSERYTSDKHCLGCSKNRNIKYYSKEKKAEWYENNKDIEKERSLNYYYNNKDHVRKVQAEWRKKRPHVYKAKLAKRRATKKRAIPRWADLEKIREIYKNCPEGMHVDHIIPLVNKEVCGLHVENNLQYLIPTENSRKGNKLMKEYTGL